MVDAGNLFVYKGDLSPTLRSTPEAFKKAVARADLIAEVFGRLGAHGIAVGGSDLALGPEALKTLARKHRLPLLSANLLDARGQRIFPASRVVKSGGITFGILGLTGDHHRARDAGQPSGFRLGDALGAAKAEVQSLRAQGAQLVIVLGAVGYSEASKIAKEVPGIDFLIASGANRHTPNPERQGAAFLLETAPGGKYIGHLTLHIRKGKLQFEDLSQRFAMAEDIRSMQRTLDAVKEPLPPNADEKRRSFVAKRIEQLQESMDSSRRLLHVANQRVPAESFLVGLMAHCVLSLPEDPAVAALIRIRSKAAGLERQPGSQ